MTAHRPRRARDLDDAALIEVLLSGRYAAGPGWRVARNAHLWRPPTDVFETDDALVVQLEVAGLQREDFAIALHEQRLTIAGQRAHPRPMPRAFYQMEVHYGEFRVEVDLPAPVQADGVSATYESGFLRVTLPKRMPRRVDVR